MSGVIAGLAGVLFGVGLVIGGMTDPRNVTGFLDVFGDWNPQLLFLMGAAIAVHAPLQVWARRRERPLLAAQFVLPTYRDIDVRLVGGAALFGIGWGISGYCPGPSVVALPSLQIGVIAFVVSLAIGSWIAQLFTKRPQARAERSDSAHANQVALDAR